MVEEKISHFKQDLFKSTLSDEELFHKHIVDGKSFFFSELLKEESKELKVRSLVAAAFGVDVHEVIIVGSAKLGYSLNPKKLFAHFDSKYRVSNLRKDKSDVDVAVISTELFDSIGQQLYSFTNSFKTKWTANEYYSQVRATTLGVPLYSKYFEYYSRGWFRPDMKPPGFEFTRKISFVTLKNDLNREINRRASIAIYKNWFYFKNYHVDNIKIISLQQKSEIL